MICPGGAYDIAEKVLDNTSVDRGPFTLGITSGLRGEKHLWGNLPFQVLPGVHMLIFLPRHLTPPLPGCRERSGRVLHRTGEPFARSKILLVCSSCAPNFSSVESSSGNHRFPGACVGGTVRGYPHLVVHRSSVDRQSASLHSSISCISPGPASVARSPLGFLPSRRCPGLCE